MCSVSCSVSTSFLLCSLTTKRRPQAGHLLRNSLKRVETRLPALKGNYENGFAGWSNGFKPNSVAQANQMSLRGRYEDVSTLLYMVPFVYGLIYGLALWVQNGVSLVLPTSVYLTVTRDPIFFVVGSLAVMLGVIIEVNGTEPGARPAKLVSLGGTLQSMAVAALVLALIFALYANGFTDLTGTATDFIIGRYGIVFPVMLVVLSYLLSAQFRVEAIGSRKVLAVIALLLVPASLYEVGKRQTALGLGIAFFLLLLGLALYLIPGKKPSPPKQE